MTSFPAAHRPHVATPWFALAAFWLLAASSPAAADRTQVYSIQGADCGDCGTEIRTELKKVKGVKKTAFDIYQVELTVTLADGVSDDVVLAAAKRAGLTAVVGGGHGAYLPHETYPEGADVQLLTDEGAAVGPLEKLRVPGKYTVFDVYADWCGPCRQVDSHLRELTTRRKDLAVRKLDVVSFQSPLAKSLGPRLKALPYVIVFAPDGKRTDLAGADLKKLDAALGAM